MLKFFWVNRLYNLCFFNPVDTRSRFNVGITSFRLQKVISTLKQRLKDVMGLGNVNSGFLYHLFTVKLLIIVDKPLCKQFSLSVLNYANMKRDEAQNGLISCSRGQYEICLEDFPGSKCDICLEYFPGSIILRYMS